MDIVSLVLIVLGLIIFEVVSSVDNAVINAEVLSTMGPRARKFFINWGIFFAVFVVRGVLPWLIIWATIPSLGLVDSFQATFSNDPITAKAIQESAPLLLMGGGVFMIFLFLHWLFLEDKKLGLHSIEGFFSRQGAWFYATVSILLVNIVWFALKQDPFLGFSAVVGSTAFFIIHGFRQHAEAVEKRLVTGHMSDISKIFYLEAIDLSFSIDGVLGAFAFTLVVPLILIGNGVGAIIVRYLTIVGVEKIRKYAYLKNGAMYSICILGIVMICEGFGLHVPAWLSPLATIPIVSYFFWRSHKEMKEV